MTQAETMSRATDRPHMFRSGGACVFCGAKPETVADRRAPPFCDERPDRHDALSGGLSDEY